MNDDAFIKKGKKRSREELRLPQLHFVVADDWIEKLGAKSFCYWLKLLSLVDRKDEAIDKYGNKSTVPRSFEDLYTNIFKISSPTFYANVVKPLWNYGLIEIAEWEASTKVGTKPKNIIVYEYPRNSFELSVKPLKKYRDYDKDYSSNSAKYGRIGGGIRKNNSKHTKNKNISKSKGESIFTLYKINKNNKITVKTKGKNNLNVTVKKLLPSRVKKIKPINYTNTHVNASNTHVNVSNIKPKEEEKEINNINTSEQDSLDSSNNKNQDPVLNIIQEHFMFLELGDFLHDKGFGSETITQTILKTYQNGVTFFRIEDVEKQYKHMMEKKDQGLVDNHNNFPLYFANGLHMRAEQTDSMEKYQKEKDRQYELAMERREEAKKQAEQNRQLYYNWLEDDSYE